jgi:hypothetical protein
MTTADFSIARVTNTPIQTAERSRLEREVRRAILETVGG